MDRSSASQLQAFFRATLLGLVLFSMITWVPHACTCLRAFLLVSLPSAASAIVTPKCLFVFSNIIVIFLANESKLSQSGEVIIDAARQQLAAFAPVVVEKEDGNHAAEEIVREECTTMVVVHDGLHQLDQCGEEDSSSTNFGVEEMREEESDVSVVNDACDANNMQGEDDLRGEVVEEEECDDEEEEMELPTDELNRRVEEFIARFNMERQLEARMLVCCC